ncbi:immune-related, lectin-like receptor 4 [Phycodurus eques]|uniref:immune-related, lectin-like receptor 4 n=1 Tax=Phycodurus eques TaxID=693459 RepID=UPI002ACE67D7|nr:immune-related, lectin-like receptor 4 [Phycodurus eques]
MPETEVLYSDLVFVKSRGNQSRDAASSAPETNSAKVIVAKTQSKPLHGAKPVRSKLTTERVAFVVVCVLLVLALVALCYISYQNVQSRKNLQRLKAEPEVWKASQSDGQIFQKDGVCRSCDSGWELNGESCYRFSTTQDTWERSRRICQLQNGNLVKIDSRDEQSFVERRLRDKMSFQEDKFWIGLTDSKQEGRWLWADGSPLDPSLSFWARNEPDNWSGDGGGEVGEDCVRMGEKDGAHELLCWFDKACGVPHRSVCEKTARKGRRPSCEFL